MNSVFVVRGEGSCLIRRDYGGAFTIMAGQRGAPGKSGAGASSTFTWTQSIALSTWTIPHNLERYPSVMVVDNLGNKVEPDIRWIDENIIQVIHGSSFSGKAYLN